MANRDTTTGPGGGSERGTAEKAKDKARDVKDKAQETVAHAAADARERGEEFVHEGKDKAREIGDRAEEKVRSQADHQKERVSEGFRSVAEALRRGGQEISDEHQQYGTFLNGIADRAEGVSRYLDERDVDSITREARRMAENNTPVFLSGAFTLGMLGARFLKSSGDRARSERNEGPYESYEPGLPRGTTRRYTTPGPGPEYGGYQTEGRYEAPEPTGRTAGQNPDETLRTTGRDTGTTGAGNPAEQERVTDINRSPEKQEGGNA